MALLCGNTSLLWDSELSWNNPDGFDLSVCFQETILVWIPFAFLFFCAPLDLVLRGWHQTLKGASLGEWLQSFKLMEIVEDGLTALILCLTLAELGINIGQQRIDSTLAVMQWLSPLLISISMIQAIAFRLIYRRMKLYNSGVMFTFWLLLAMKTIMSTISILRWKEQTHSAQIIDKSLVGQNNDTSLLEYTLHHEDQLKSNCIADWTQYFGLEFTEDREAFVVRSKILIGFLVLVQLVLFCMQESRAKTGRTNEVQLCAEENAPILSWLTISWFNKVVSMAFKKRLEQEDLINLAPNFLLETKSETFQENLRLSIEKALEIRDKRIELVGRLRENMSTPIDGPGELGRLMGQLESRLNPIDLDELLFHSKASDADVVSQLESLEQRAKFVNIFIVMLKTFKWQFLQCFLFKLLSIAFEFSVPFIMNEHINFLTHRRQNEPFWHGWFYILGLLIPNLLETLVDNREAYVLANLTIDLTTCCRIAIYQKTARLSVLARKGQASGAIINMLTIDVERVIGFVGVIDTVVIAPIRIALAVGMLYYHFGLAALATIPISLFAFPSNAIVGCILRPIVVNSNVLRDFRMKLVTELFNAIKIIKIYAWENSFIERIANIRKAEGGYIRTDGFVMTFQMFQYTFMAPISMIVVFSIYLYTGNSSATQHDHDSTKGSGLLGMLSTLVGGGSSDAHILTPNRIFVGITLFNMITEQISSLSNPMSSLFIFRVALNRLNRFLEREECKESNGDESLGARADQYKSPYAITMSNANFRWDSKMDFELRNITLEIPRGKLVAIVGRIGSGKSSLLSAILGDIEQLSGECKIDKRSSIGYVCQEAWILNDSIVNNICLGQAFDAERYAQIVDACALQADLDTFPAGDQSEIGERGLNLSSGQKQRISLARAIYLNAEIILLDDPLSAVDAHIGKHLFEQVLSASSSTNGERRSLLADKTRVLVTNKVSILPQVDHIYVMDDGQIVESGSCLELLAAKNYFTKFYLQHLQADNSRASHTKSHRKHDSRDGDDDDSDIERSDTWCTEQLTLSSKEHKLINAEVKRLEKSMKMRQKKLKVQVKQASDLVKRRVQAFEPNDLDDNSSIMTRRSSVANLIAHDHGSQRMVVHKMLTNDEDHLEVLISDQDRSDMYWLIVKSTGFKAIWGILLVVISEIFMVGANYWLAKWSNDSAIPLLSKIPILTKYRLIIFAILRVGEILFGYLGVCLFGLAFVKLSLNLHDNALTSVLNAPMSWFDRTPIGRLLNIFSNDVEIIDDQVRLSIIMLMMNLATMISSLVIVSMGSYYTILIAIPLLVVYVLMYLYYIPTSRQLERIQLATTAPIYSHFNETIAGLSTIRAFKLNDFFTLKMKRILAENNVSHYLNVSSLRWFDVRLRALSLFIVLIVSLVSILTMGSTTPGIAALTITYAIGIAPSLGSLITLWSSVQQNLISIERVRKYTKIVSERLLLDQKPENEKSWPERGEIEFDAFSGRYRPELELVLRKFSLCVKPGEKVGLVGRTGAGKSSITLAIFRIFEAAEGRILIDDLDISQLDLRYLRSRLSIIPQEPLLFTGCIRQNIDPMGDHTDTQIWSVIKMAHLEDFVRSLPNGLEQEVSEAGSNFSVGQKQLFCLARAILKRSKILLLDEASAALDLATDELIQRTIRKEFADSTIITVAHRLETIMDYDRVAVIDAGQLVEIDTPDNLLKKEQSKFYALAKEDGLV